MSIVLASQSPRRKELLQMIVPEFLVCPADIDESQLPGEPPEQYVLRIARLKAHKISQSNPQAIVIASDTIVTFEQTIYGKPATLAEARATLQTLSGQTHLVYTSVVLQQGEQIEEAFVPTSVTFYPLTEIEISNYLMTKDYQDKAGSYGIQGPAAIFIQSIQGDYYSVMGLPIATVHRLLRKFKH